MIEAVEIDHAARVAAYDAAVAQGFVPLGGIVGTGRRSAVSVAAEDLGIGAQALKGSIKRLARQGLRGTAPVLPGFVLKRISTQLGPDGKMRGESIQQVPEPGEAFALPNRHMVKGISALVDADGNTIQQWIKTSSQPSPELTIETIKAAFDDYKPCAAPAPAPRDRLPDMVTLYPFADWHIGMFSWGRETGQNWDLKIAERVISSSMADLVASSPASAHAIVLGGGDLLHADNSQNQTARSGNALDVDGRYQKVLSTACHLVVSSIDTALTKHAKVTVRILPGNHDEHASRAVTMFLVAWYRQEPRVTIDSDPSAFFWHRFGAVMLGATHGHNVKISDMAGIMAHRRASDWGETRHRYVHGFHIHHKTLRATEGGGVITETHQTPIPQDAWHHESGFLSGRSMQSITYHRDLGEVGRSRRAIMDVAS